MPDLVHPGTAWAAPEQLAIGFDVPLVGWRRCPVCLGAWRPYRPGLPYGGAITYVVKRQHWVKVGHTRNLTERLGVLRRGTPGCVTVHPEEMDWAAPLVLLGQIAGAVEHELHERFADCHAAGEWFRPDEEMTEWLTSFRRPPSVSPTTLP